MRVQDISTMHAESYRTTTSRPEKMITRLQSRDDDSIREITSFHAYAMCFRPIWLTFLRLLHHSTAVVIIFSGLDPIINRRCAIYLCTIYNYYGAFTIIVLPPYSPNLIELFVTLSFFYLILYSFNLTNILIGSQSIPQELRDYIDIPLDTLGTAGLGNWLFNITSYYILLRHINTICLYAWSLLGAARLLICCCRGAVRDQYTRTG